VAPWLDTHKTLSTDFFGFTIDQTLPERTELHILISSDDDQDLPDSFLVLKQKLSNAIWHEFTDKGHFCEMDLGGKAFPELLDLLK
jgi:hypothetical protein